MKGAKWKSTVLEILMNWWQLEIHCTEFYFYQINFVSSVVCTLARPNDWCGSHHAPSIGGAVARLIPLWFYSRLLLLGSCVLTSWTGMTPLSGKAHSHWRTFQTRGQDVRHVGEWLTVWTTRPGNYLTGADVSRTGRDCPHTLAYITRQWKTWQTPVYVPFLSSPCEAQAPSGTRTRIADFWRIKKIPYQAPPTQCTFWKNAIFGHKFQCLDSV